MNFVYVSRFRRCGCAYAVVVDDPKRLHIAVEAVTETIESGNYVERMTVQDFRAKVDLMPENCPQGEQHQ